MSYCYSALLTNYWLISKSLEKLKKQVRYVLEIEKIVKTGSSIKNYFQVLLSITLLKLDEQYM